MIQRLASVAVGPHLLLKTVLRSSPGIMMKAFLNTSLSGVPASDACIRHASAKERHHASFVHHRIMILESNVQESPASLRPSAGMCA